MLKFSVILRGIKYNWEGYHDVLLISLMDSVTSFKTIDGVMSFSRNKGFKTTDKRLHHKVLEISSCNGGKHKKK